MESSNKEISKKTLDLGYEDNNVGLRGIIGFSLGMLALIVVTFVLMAIFVKVMKDQADETDVKSPMMMSKEEKLPPEPRLQGAPGFGVGEGKERVNLELKAPQTEYWTLREQWEKLEKDGQKDAKGNYVTLPVEEAKERFLKDASVKFRSGEAGEESLSNAKKVVSGSSAGHATEVRR